MKQRQFSLQPFPSDTPLPNLQVKGKISGQSDYLRVHYQIFGDLDKVEIVSVVDTPVRKHELWQETCFEFFLAIPSASSYWEFNLSPSGNWNVYRFHDYRQGMQEEQAFSSLTFQFQRESDHLSVDIDVNLRAIIPNFQELEIALTTVIKHCSGEFTYWALNHTGNEADFHRRDSFIQI
jgi:hypothetical protein